MENYRYCFRWEKKGKTRHCTFQNVFCCSHFSHIRFTWLINCTATNKKFISMSKSSGMLVKSHKSILFKKIYVPINWSPTVFNLTRFFSLFLDTKHATKKSSQLFELKHHKFILPNQTGFLEMNVRKKKFQLITIPTTYI